MLVAHSIAARLVNNAVAAAIGQGDGDPPAHSGQAERQAAAVSGRGKVEIPGVCDSPGCVGMATVGGPSVLAASVMGD